MPAMKDFDKIHLLHFLKFFNPCLNIHLKQIKIAYKLDSVIFFLKTYKGHAEIFPELVKKSDSFPYDT